ncbi:MAG: ThiF family adenylyltransferase [Deltaproteobacteria bacterium]|nr:ThiF family adenylyltransferase [Nannocystaceae bacterium]
MTITGVIKAVGTSWELPIEIDANTTGGLIAQITPWVVRIDRSYPYGAIAVFPAANGIAVTFQHQDTNTARVGASRSGKLCLDHPYRNRTVMVGTDPIADADSRLAWHFARAQEWVVRAATGDLVRVGDPFEIPKVDASSGSLRVIHDESNRSLSTWRPFIGHFGQVHFRVTPVRNTVVASKFTDRDRHVIQTSSLFPKGTPAQGIHGVWWLWRRPLVSDPWKAVTAWGELAALGEREGVDAFAVLEEISHALRGNGRMFLMLGYPIPKKLGEPDHEIHWETVRMPLLTKAPPKGFRPSRKAWWQSDRRQLFGDKHSMAYVETENWHPDRVQARGRLPESVYRKKVVIIGCGALGSMVAELLVRGGLLELLLIDGEVLEAGNLARHVLTSTSVGVGKASALAKRLREVSPTANTSVVEHHLADPQAVHDRLEDADLVIDCTATNEIPTLLAETYWSVPRRFISASFGYAARHLFLFRSFGVKFPAKDFFSSLEPWLVKERREWAQAEERFEGAGCYSPLFPARADDVAAGAVAVVKFSEEAIEASRDEDEFVVLRATRYGGFCPTAKSEEDAGIRAA